MNNTADTQRAILRDQFNQMQQADSALLPALPTEHQMQAKTVALPHRFSHTPWKFAVAASLVALVIVVANKTTSDDPAAVYANIMNANAITTDSFMHVTDSALPESNSLQNLFSLGDSLTTAVKFK